MGTNQTVIENPVINSPFVEPQRHFRFADEGITNEIIEGRRVSSYFIPIAAPKKKGKKQLYFDTEWTKDRIEENKFINQIRERISRWRTGGYVGVTKTTARLLEYWKRTDRDRRLFFCQIEALETAIYLTEVASKYGDAWIENELRRVNEDANPLLFRIAFKMATGSGKTVVMAMLIAWQTLNKLANPQDARFSDTFLIVTPGITIRDRLRVLLPNDPDNYYRKLDILPPDCELNSAKILITNFHAFKFRETISAGKLTKNILKQGENTYATAASKCHVSHVVLDSNWEAKMAQVLEDEMDEVISYVKNFQLGFNIPYTLDGEERNYLPDYIVRVDDGHGKDDLLNLIVEVTGERKKDKAAKVATARTLWIPAVNNHAAYGRWTFVEITDPWDAKNTIRAALAQKENKSKP